MKAILVRLPLMILVTAGHSCWYSSCAHAEDLREAQQKVLSAIEARRARVHALDVAGVTTRIRSQNITTGEEYPEPVSSLVPFRWQIDPANKRFRLDETSEQTDPSNGAPILVETVIAFDGTAGIAWTPQPLIMSDGLRSLDANKMSATNRSLSSRAFGPIFWWLGIMDDHDALIEGRTTDFDDCAWRKSQDGGEIVATIRIGSQEREFTFSKEQEYNVVSATHRLHAGGEVFVSSSTTVTYERRDGLVVPVMALRELGQKLDSTEYTRWETVSTLPIAETQLPKGFITPGKLISDDQSRHILHVSNQGTLVPRLPGNELPARESNYSFVSIAAVVFMLLSFLLWRRWRSRTL